MASMPLIEQAVPVAVSENAAIITRERRKSLMLRAWIGSGLFFMALPGTLMGFSNLMAISAHHGLGNLPAAWMEGHGHAQMFGWIGSFILGIGFYSQPAHGRSVLRVPLSCCVLWISGVAMRWLRIDLHGHPQHAAGGIVAGMGIHRTRYLVRAFLGVYAVQFYADTALDANPRRYPVRDWSGTIRVVRAGPFDWPFNRRQVSNGQKH